VASLVRAYQELLPLKERRPYLWARLIDIDRALETLPPTERLAVLLFGQAQMTLSASASLAGWAPSTLYDRYWRGINRMTEFLNRREP
jgi:DNA-directed RNA polymerase specialized sigma24 family protein